ncbi:MAG: single-stranded-DNA-specific exonuclease RecJ [Parvularculaceae bacterium]
MSAITEPVATRLDAAALVDLPAMGATASGRVWSLAEVDPAVSGAVAEAAGIDLTLARVLTARGVGPEDARAFLNPSLRDTLPDPSTLADMNAAADRIAKAIQLGEKVGVFGDYDVDGTTAATLLKLYFNAVGAPLSVYLPDRIAEGYGPSIEAFRILKEQGAKLIITVDCGAAAHDAIEAAAREGIKVIVFDHHLMAGPAPEGAFAVVNPNRPDDASGLGGLSAAGVAFMGLVAVNRALRAAGFFSTRTEPALTQWLDIVALGLVCDVMPLTGLTRILVAQGLKVLGGGGNPGLKALGARAGVKGPPTAYHLGFLLGPRINAAGRVGHARLAFDLLTTDDPEKRASLAERLHVMNAERRAIETDVLDTAIAQIERRGADAPVIVAAGEGWHPGVIGIVAGRLKERYDRPAFVIGFEGDAGKGSGRSISGVDLGAAVVRAREEGLLAAGGGHAMAAGLTIARGGLDAFADFLNRALAADVARARTERTRVIDGVVAASAVSKSFAESIAGAGPFGSDNPEPLFVLTDMRAEYVKIAGGDHISCTLMSETGDMARAIAFRAAGEPLGAMLGSGRRLHVAGKVRADDWRGGGAGQLHIVDAAYAE